MFFVSSKVYSRERCHFSLVSKIIQGDTRVRTRDFSDYSRMLYHWVMSPLHTDSIISLQTHSGCLSTVTMFFVPSKMYSRVRCHFSLVFQKFYKGTPGTSRTRLQPIALPLSSISAAYRFNNITANTSRLFEHCYNVFRSESSVLSRSMSFFSSLSKIIQGDTLCSNQGSLGLQPNALPRAISPLHTDSKISLQTRSGRLSTVTKFFVPSKVYSCDRCHFSLVSKIIQGDTRVRTRDLADCSRMLYHWVISPLHTDSIISLQTHSGSLSTVTMFLFRVKGTLAMDVIFV